MTTKITVGALASMAGREHEKRIFEYLIGANLRYNEYASTIKGVLSGNGSLYEDNAVGEFGCQIEVPLQGIAHQDKKRCTKVDFAIATFKSKPVLLSVKSQNSNGSAEEKIWFEIQQLIDTQIPSAMVVIGPIKSEGSPGWTRRTIEMVWDMSYCHGKNVLLFRNYESLNRWLFDKFPVPGIDGTFNEIWKKYADKNP